MVTLKDIAKECGVSFSTVSKALQGSAEISSEKIKLIQTKAQEMGYHPNIAARTLRTNKTYDIGVIFEDKTGTGLQHQYFAKILSGFQEIATAHNYDITFTGASANTDYDYYKHIMGRSLDGVAILSADFKRPDLQKLVASGLPLITLDYKYDDNHLSVLSNNTKGMDDLTNYVISKGHTKIAMMYGEDTLVTKERKTIFNKILEEHNITLPDEYYVQGQYYNSELSRKATEQLLSLPNPPTCIFFPDDFSALGGIKAIHSRGLTPGKDISIVGYDGILLTSMLVPPLTTYEQDGNTIGRTMATLLIEQIEKKQISQNRTILINGKLIPGGTVKSLI